MSRIQFTAFLLLAFFLKAGAQQFEQGKVSVKDLTQKTYPPDSTAAAAILYTKAKSHFVYHDKQGFSLVHDYQLRIKIYKKEGLKWADFKVPYYVGYETLANDRVSFSSAVTYNLEGTQIVKTKTNSEGRFKNNVNELWNEASIAMSNVKPGSIIEISYTHQSQDIVAFPQFDFQHDIPVAYAEYVTEIPEFFRYKPTKIGFGQVESNAKIVNGFQNFQNEHKQTVNLNFQQVNSTYTARNIPALKEEPYIDNIENYRLSVAHELEKTIFPDAPEKNYATTWEGVASSIYKDKRFGDELKQRGYFEPFLQPILKNAVTETEKATAIFKYVKRTISWDKYKGYYARNGVKKAFESRTGNIADINFILIAMLNSSGITAHPVLLSTVDHGIPVFPNRTIFNYVIAAIEIDGKQILLDATDAHTAFNILPMRVLNWTGRLIKPDGSSKEIQLAPQTPSRQIFNMMAKIGSDAKVSGKLKVVKTDYEAQAFHEKDAGLNKEQYIEKLENRYNQISISDFSSDNTADVSKPVSETFNFVAQNDSEIIGDKIFINPLLFFTMNTNPFVLEERQFPVYYGYPFQMRYNINLEIPEGYVVESLPKSVKIVTGEDVGSFTFNINNADNKIQITVSKEINKAIVSGAFYEDLKEFYKKMIEKQAEKIILKKV